MHKGKAKVLHIVNDEKFIKDAINIFSKSSEDYHQLALVGKKKKLKHLKNMNVVFINPLSLLPLSNVSIIKNFDILIFHGLKGFKFNLLKKIPSDKSILWIGYGFDYYHLIKPLRDDFLLPKTRQISGQKCKVTSKRKKWFFKVFEPGLNAKLKLLSKIDFFNTVVKEEHYIFHKVLGDFIPEFIDWNYPILTENLITKFPVLDQSEGNILIGNSNSKTNNHLDAFELLKLHNIPGGNIICPLSYGGNQDYRSAVIEKGNSMFGDRFVPLVDFLNSEDYFRLLADCSYYFSPTLRQQAFGNILMMLYLGASVILYEDNPIYPFLKKKGFLIFSDRDMMNYNLKQLSSEEKKINKELLIENYSEKALIRKTSKLLEKLRENGQR